MGTPDEPLSTDPMGKRAFEMEIGRLTERIIVSDNNPKVREISRAISRARESAEAGDYIGAIRVLGDVEVRIDESGSPKREASVKPEDVEQALGDLRRALKRVTPSPLADSVRKLCQAAREEAVRGRWEAAWALIDEADQRLGEAGGQAKGSP